MTCMTIDEIKDFINLNNPSMAFLGRAEMQDMRKYFAERGIGKFSNADSDLYRLDYNGCPLFEVDSKHHTTFIVDGKAY